MAKIRNKRARRAGGVHFNGAEDLISRLPDEILTYILSFVSPRSSVSTCVLSKRWSRLWISVPNLDFDGRGLSPCSVKRSQFENFVDHFLSLNDVRSVRVINLRYHGNHEISRVKPWIDAISKRDAQKIHLTLPTSSLPGGGDLGSQFCSLPDNFFIQKNLVELKLTWAILKIPQLVCFPNLKRIDFISITFFDDSSMKNLLSGSPILRTLHMQLGNPVNKQKLCICSSSLCDLDLYIHAYKNSHYDAIVIDCPSLKHLSLSDYGCSTYNIRNVSSLTSTYLCILDDGKILTNLLTKVSHVKDLGFNPLMFKFSCDRSFANMPMLLNLIHLKADISMRHDSYKAFFHLLKCTPNLVTLIIKKGTGAGAGAGPYPCCKAYEVPQCFLSSIESIEIEDVGNQDQDIQMIAYILKNAMVLKKFSIICHPQVLAHETKFLSTLLTLPRSSATCWIEYKLREVIRAECSSD